MSVYPLMTDQDLADYLNTTRRVIRYWRSNGAGPPAFALGRHTLRWRREDVDAWLMTTR